MKLIREHIVFEKFTKDSDPIIDMNIGIEEYVKNEIKHMHSQFENYYEAYDWFKSEYNIEESDLYDDKQLIEEVLKLRELLGEENVKVLNDDIDIQNKCNKFLIDSEYLRCYYKQCEKQYLNPWLKKGWIVWAGPEDCYGNFQAVLVRYHSIKENVNEKFTQDTDPVKDMGIGAIQVYYYFYITMWAEDILIDFENPNHVKLLNWLKFNKAVNLWDSKQRYEFVNLTKKARITLYSNGKMQYPNFSRINGPDIMIRVASTDDEKKLFSRGIYREWVWNWNDIPSEPGPKYLLIKDIKRRMSDDNLQPSHVMRLVNEKFTQDSDPIEDMGIGLNAQMKKINAKVIWDWDILEYPGLQERIIDIENYAPGEFVTPSKSINTKQLYIKVSQIIETKTDYQHANLNKAANVTVKSKGYFAISNVGEIYVGKPAPFEYRDTPEKAMAKEKKWLIEYFDSL